MRECIRPVWSSRGTDGDTDTDKCSARLTWHQRLFLCSISAPEIPVDNCFTGGEAVWPECLGGVSEKVKNKPISEVIRNLIKELIRSWDFAGIQIAAGRSHKEDELAAGCMGRDELHFVNSYFLVIGMQFISHLPNHQGELNYFLIDHSYPRFRSYRVRCGPAWVSLPTAPSELSYTVRFISTMFVSSSQVHT